MTANIQSLSVEIAQFVDESFPGWVECHFADAAGRVHTLVDKYPMFTAQMLDAHSQYPQLGEVECEVLDRSQDARRGELVRIRMVGIESTEGLSEFVVLPMQMSSHRH